MKERKNGKYAVLLYYCYSHINSPESYREEHHLFCIDNNLLGRIIIAQEGLNGTVSGTWDNCQKYIDYIKNDARFSDTEFKVNFSDALAFQKLHVRVKNEIVHSGLTHIHPKEKTGKYLEPKEFKELKNTEDAVILDVRSKYEHDMGHFKNAVTLNIQNFRDFPSKVKELEYLKNKKVITYCTGGVKCEKASSYLLEQGFENVYQLHGGIIKYGLETDGKDFEGKCYVFDNRLTTEINQTNPSVVSQCYVCGCKSDRMVNCANPHCNKHVPICENCGNEMDGACSEECKKHPDKRSYDCTGYYTKHLNGYNPLKGWKQNSKTSSKIANKSEY